MNHDIPLKYFDIADEYATECAEPVAEAERTPLAHYFQLLLTSLKKHNMKWLLKRGLIPYALMRSQSF